MLEPARGLSASAQRALAELEERTLAVDGGRLKLEWGVLRSRSGAEVEDLLWWGGGRLLGYAGLYAFGPPSVELAGMVDPAARRQGIGTELLDAALDLARGRARAGGYRQALLVTPTGSPAGRAFALARGARLEHAEHALVLAGAPPDGPPGRGEAPALGPRPGDAVALRPAGPGDAPELTRLLTVAFGRAPADVAERLRESLATGGSEALVGMVEGEVVATVRLTLEDGVGGVYGLAVDPARQGRGIGREVLRRGCLRLRAAGAREVRLEVAVDNARALGLYTSLGFVPAGGEDYYALPLA